MLTGRLSRVIAHPPHEPKVEPKLSETVTVMREMINELAERIDVLEAREVLSRNPAPTAGSAKVRE